MCLSDVHNFFNCCAASPQPQVVRVTLKSQDGIILGQTQVIYEMSRKELVSSPNAMKKFVEEFMSGDPSGTGNLFGNSGGETKF